MSKEHPKLNGRHVKVEHVFCATCSTPAKPVLVDKREQSEHCKRCKKDILRAIAKLRRERAECPDPSDYDVSKARGDQPDPYGRYVHRIGASRRKGRTGT